MVPLSEVATVVDGDRERSRYHKNLQPVTYVYGDVAGRFERKPPNEDKSFFESERSSYWYSPEMGSRVEEYMPFHD
jgi:multidrug efflux pump subunit AcrB